MELILISGDLESRYPFNVMEDGSRVRRCHGEPRLVDLLHLRSFGVESIMIGTLVSNGQCVASFGIACGSAGDAERAAHLIADHIWR